MSNKVVFDNNLRNKARMAVAAWMKAADEEGVGDVDELVEIVTDAMQDVQEETLASMVHHPETWDDGR